MKSSCSVPPLLMALVVAIGADRSLAVEIGVVALSDQQGTHGPGDVPGAEFRGFDTPVINNRGTVAFSASIRGSGILTGTQRGLWMTAGGVITGPVRSGTSASGHNGDTYTNFGQLNLTDSGALVFSATNGDSASLPFYDGGLWVHHPDGITTRLKRFIRRPSSHLTDQTVSGPAWFAANASNRAAFASINDAEVTSQVISVTATSFGIFGKPTQAFYLHSAGEGMPWTGADHFRINDAGTIAFTADVHPSGGEPVPSLFRSHYGTISVVARKGGDGSDGPQLGEGVTFANSQFDATLNAQGHMAFAAQVAGPSITMANDAGIWRVGDDLEPTLVVREGDELPGVGPLHARFRRFSRPVMNASGTIAFYANAAPPGAPNATREGIWSYSQEGSQVVAFNGTDGLLGPQLGPGVKFHGFDDPTINDAGLIAFKGYLRTVDNATDLGSGLWAFDGQQLLSVVHTGQVIDLDTGLGTDFRTVEEAFMQSGVGSGEGLARSLSNDGVLAFRLTFTDGSEGIFSARVGGAVAVPEPATMVILGLGVVVLVGVCRGRKCPAL